MFNFTTNVPELDFENQVLFQASALLESIGNSPNPTTTEFYDLLTNSDLPAKDHESITLAAISIETMMSLDLQYEESSLAPPTVH